MLVAKEFEIDVAGSDLFNRGHSIIVSERNTNNVHGFKFNEEIIQKIKVKYAEEKSHRIRVMLKIRIYCIIIYYIFKNMKLKENTYANLSICRDFHGHERDISSQLKYFLEALLKLNITIHYGQLSKDSVADRYAYIALKDTKNLFPGYVNISLEDIEKFLRK